MTSAELGRAGESLAARLLTQAGYQVLCRGFRAAGGEIDLVACNDAYLVFAEVKTRTGAMSGTPAEAVDLRKQKRLVQAANAYCMQHPDARQPRFDVIEVLVWPGRPPRLRARWLQNAFDVPDSYQSI